MKLAAIRAPGQDAVQKSLTILTSSSKCGSPDDPCWFLWVTWEVLRNHRAKIQGAIGWHTLRQSYRAWLDETGAPLGVQQKLMRHANISTTMNVYGGAFMDAKRKANTSVVRRVFSQK